jgi:AcrR family transcriptional regulator
MTRPRSVKAHAAVLDAAVQLFAERGVDATSMDAVAAESGVSKATIYKHWTDKDALCLEVLARLHGRDQPLPDPDSGDVAADILSVLTYEPPEEFADLRMRLMPHLMAHASRNPAFGKAWKATVFDPPRLQLRTILDRAITRDALPRMLDRDVAIALLLGPMMYAHVQKVMHRPPPIGLAQATVAAFWKAFGAVTPKGAASKARGTVVVPPPRKAAASGRGATARRG